MDKKSKLGYKKDSPYKNEKSIKIKSNSITMKGVEFPIIGYPDNDPSQVMYPGQDYFFPNSSSVTEVPMKNKYQQGGKILEQHLSKLTPEEQDKFIDNFSSLSANQQNLALMSIRVMMHGGKYQQGGRALGMAEVEGDETVLTPDQQLYKFEGPSHSEGGIPTVLEPGAKIFSEHRKAPKEIAEQVLGRKTNKTYSYADLSKKFPTQPFVDILEDDKLDKYKKKTAELQLAKNQANLETIFFAQEKEKPRSMVVDRFQDGGTKINESRIFNPNKLDLSSISHRFENIEGSKIKRDPVTGNGYIRNADGTYREIVGDKTTAVKESMNPILNYEVSDNSQYYKPELGKSYDMSTFSDRFVDEGSGNFWDPETKWVYHRNPQTGQYQAMTQKDKPYPKTKTNSGKPSSSTKNDYSNISTDELMGRYYSGTDLGIDDQSIKAEIDRRTYLDEAAYGNMQWPNGAGKVKGKSVDDLSKISTEELQGKYDSGVDAGYPDQSIRAELDRRIIANRKKEFWDKAITRTEGPSNSQGPLTVDGLSGYPLGTPVIDEFGVPDLLPRGPKAPTITKDDYWPNIPWATEHNTPEPKIGGDRIPQGKPKPQTKTPTASPATVPTTPVVTPAETPVEVKPNISGFDFSKIKKDIEANKPFTPNPIDVAEVVKKSKFGISPELAGTIADIGLALSDELHVQGPAFYDRRKYPLFNRFYEFDDKEVQRMYQLGLQQVQNSNMPEAVKQAQKADILAKSQDYQSKVDFANLGRYEEWRGSNLNKLQTYMDANTDIRYQDMEDFRKRKAQVDYLKDQFKAQKKSRIVNSIKGYADYVDKIHTANETIGATQKYNPFTGKVEYVPQNETKLREDMLKSYHEQAKNKIQIAPNVSGTMMGNKMVIVDANNNVQIMDLGEAPTKK